MAAGLILPATPAYAATPHKIDNLGAGKCLSNNSSGYAVTENCNASYAKQKWQINAHIQPTFNALYTISGKMVMASAWVSQGGRGQI
jgi:hypothetical protein